MWFEGGKVYHFSKALTAGRLSLQERYVSLFLRITD